MLEKYFKVILSPLYSEKASNAAALSKYYFKVSPTANKNDVKEAVEKIFNVVVEKVNILNTKSKTKRFKNTLGKTKSFKKATVTLKEGTTIDFTVGA